MKKLSKLEINQRISPYLTAGRKHESWVINNIELDHSGLVADVEMVETYNSHTDDGKFHLTVFASLEFLSQLMIIWGHERADLDKKTEECWMAESSIKCPSSIRSKNLKVEMHTKKFRIRNDVIYVKADFIICSNNPGDGEFLASLTGFLK